MAKNRNTTSTEQKAQMDISSVFDEATELGDREQARLFNKWYKAVRKGSSVLSAKKRLTDISNAELVEMARDLTIKLNQLLEPSV